MLPTCTASMTAVINVTFKHPESWTSKYLGIKTPLLQVPITRQILVWPRQQWRVRMCPAPFYRHYHFVLLLFLAYSGVVDSIPLTNPVPWCIFFLFFASLYCRPQVFTSWACHVRGRAAPSGQHPAAEAGRGPGAAGSPRCESSRRRPESGSWPRWPPGWRWS